MKPLPRLLAPTTDALCRAPDFAARAAALASVGAEVALVVRMPAAPAAELAAAAERMASLTRSTGAGFLVHARPDLARALGADGVQLRGADLAPADVRRWCPGWLGVSVHGREAAERAIGEGADFLVAGNVFTTASHPERPARGLDWLAALCGLGRPVFAIGGVTRERAGGLLRAGAWGAAAIGALWQSADPAAAARELLAAWKAAA